MLRPFLAGAIIGSPAWTAQAAESPGDPAKPVQSADGTPDAKSLTGAVIPHFVCTQPKSAFVSATSATKANNIARTLIDKAIPSLAPRQSASTLFTADFSTSNLQLSPVGLFSVSGSMIFEISNAAGALITDAVMISPAFSPLKVE